LTRICNQAIQEIETHEVRADLGLARDRFFHACDGRLRFSDGLWLLTRSPNQAIQEIETHEVCPGGKPRRDFLCRLSGIAKPADSPRL
jgi:hypothetical protein